MVYFQLTVLTIVNPNMPSEKETNDDPDSALWQAATKDVRKLPGKGHGKVPSRAKKALPSIRETVKVRRSAAPEVRSGAGLDRKTDDHLRKGRMEIEARLDLHGCRQEEARRMLRRFIEGSHAKGHRCVLVITGKGREKEQDADWWETPPGILRKSLPEWLKEAPLNDIVLQTHPARQRDGGGGAVYVLLRRRR
ncbi:MAG: Smr/MutS family protein [Alphaproteobacteria bacterium]|nr:Smr/MutS family protein [Alphaproteobacteria bacterium]